MKNNEKHSNDERRDFERVKVDLAIIYQINKPWFIRMLISGKEIVAEVLDLSEGGIAISTNCDVPVSTAILLKIMIYKLIKENNFKIYMTVEIEGEITSSVLVDTDNYRIGIRFTKIDGEQRKELINFIEEKNKGDHQENKEDN